MTDTASGESSTINRAAESDGFVEVVGLLQSIMKRQDELLSSQAMHYRNLMMEMSRFHSRVPETHSHPPIAKVDVRRESDKMQTVSPSISSNQRMSYYKPRQTKANAVIEYQGGCSFLRPFVKSSYFDTFSAVLLLTNTIFLGVQVDYSYDEQSSFPLFVIDTIYAALFATEIILRLLADGLRGFFFGVDRYWNLFDFVVVGLSSIDTVFSFIFPDGLPLADISVVRIVRTIRITRVLRVIRVIKFFREMRIMILAIASTLNTAFWAFVLTIVCSYVFAIAITQLTSDYLHSTSSASETASEDVVLMTKYFGGIARCLLTLFMSVTGGISWEDALRSLFKVGIIPSSLMLGYILFTALCMINVIIGIFCQNAVEAFDQDKERVIESRMLEHGRYVDLLTDLFNQWDVLGEGKISVETFQEHCMEREVQALLHSMEVDAKDAVALFELLDSQDGNGDGCLDLDEFVEGCITVRGSANAIHMEKSYAAQKTMQQTVHNVLKKVTDVYNLTLQNIAESNQRLAALEQVEQCREEKNKHVKRV
eukprot:TRINITY_DN4674_c0_g2_i1.p1 TRINITY_DN4674_c0_g2~~TRINITY_DN4674_c0_g2_i1.p1  ORF type:complete len:539 (+),score=61.16 TRINITY_DN4674_c0_g2_i1:78-1694(+)